MQNFETNHSAIVLGLSECGLGFIRSLGINGVEVYGFDYSKPGQPGFYSKYARTSLCPHPVYQREGLVRFLIDCSKGKNKKPVLLITADELVKFVSDNRDELSKFFLFQLPPRELIDNIIDKKNQYELVSQLGFFIPQTYCPQSLEELYSLKDKLQYPLIIKGRYSFTWREKFAGSFKGFEIFEFDKLVATCKMLFEKNIPFLLQGIVDGPEHNIFQSYVYKDASKHIHAQFDIMKIRQFPQRYGNGSSIESITREDLHRESLRFFDAIAFEGLGAVEFKFEPKTKKFIFIELNPRLAMQNFLATTCGMNLPFMQYLALTEQAVNVPDSYKSGVRWVSIVVDLKSFLGQNKLSISAIFKWIKFVLSCRVFSVFFIKDIKPAFVAVCGRLSSRNIFRFIKVIIKDRKK